MPTENILSVSAADSSAASAADAFSLSVCVCTMDRVDILRRCLESVAAGDVLPREVVVSDDSRDPSPTEALCGAYPFVRYVRGPQRGLCANRNSAIRASSGKYLSFLDDDALLAPDFVRLATALTLSASPAVIFTGDLLEGEARSRLTPTNSGFWGHFGVPPQGRCQTVHINCNLIPRAAFDKATFDEHLIYGYDELDICAQLLAAGYRIEYQPLLLNRHLPPVKTEAVRARERRLAEEARFYTSLKRYWRLQHNPLKAAAYLVLAPLHRIGFDIKTRDWPDIPQAFRDMRTALRALRASRPLP